MLATATAASPVSCLTCGSLRALDDGLLALPGPVPVDVPGQARLTEVLSDGGELWVRDDDLDRGEDVTGGRGEPWERKKKLFSLLVAPGGGDVMAVQRGLTAGGDEEIKLQGQRLKKLERFQRVAQIN